MVLDFGLCWAVETGCKALFADLAPGEIVTRGEDRRIKRRVEEAARKVKEEAQKLVEGVQENGVLPELKELVKKVQ
jgi:cation-transporting ATPase 13A1